MLYTIDLCPYRSDLFPISLEQLSPCSQTPPESFLGDPRHAPFCPFVEVYKLEGLDALPGLYVGIPVLGRL